MDKLLKIDKLIAYGSEAVQAICVATETVKNFIASRKAKSKTTTDKPEKVSLAHKVIGYTTIAERGLTSTVVDLRVILQIALVANATSIIATHNHPSGVKRPR